MEKRLLIVSAAIVLFIGIVVFFVYTASSPDSLFAQIIKAQTPTILYKPNQKQTTFFEKQPTDIPTKAPTKAPDVIAVPEADPQTIPPRPLNTKAPTQAPGQPLPQQTPKSIPTVPTSQTAKKFCTDLEPITNNCECNWGSGDRFNQCKSPSGEIIEQYKRTDDGYTPPTTDSSGNTCYTICITKPVIYLYPPSPMYVSVHLTIPGRVYISDPLYGPKGWPNVYAYPNGKLSYEGRTYKELYYEFELYEDIKAPTNGIYIERKNLRKDLTNYLYRLGLSPSETYDFLVYWLPHLNKLQSKYIIFSLFDHSYKQSIDEVHINPKPDVFIEYLVYFKPSDTLEPIEYFSFPDVPARKGFTAVEWGGYIDDKEYLKKVK